MRLTAKHDPERGELRENRQRLDKWLWHARVVRSRSAASELIQKGYVRVNGSLTPAAGHQVRLDDVVTVALDRTIRVLRVAGFAERRGPPATAQSLFADLSENARQVRTGTSGESGS